MHLSKLQYLCLYFDSYGLLYSPYALCGAYDYMSCFISLAFMCMYMLLCANNPLITVILIVSRV